MSPWILKSHRATACFFYAHLRNIIFDSWQFKPLLIPSSASRCFCSHLSVQMYWLFFSDVFCCTVKIIGIPVNSIPDIPVISIPWSTVQDTGRFCLPLWSPISLLCAKKRSLIKWMGLQRSKKKLRRKRLPLQLCLPQLMPLRPWTNHGCFLGLQWPQEESRAECFCSRASRGEIGKKKA